MKLTMRLMICVVLVGLVKASTEEGEEVFKDNRNSEEEVRELCCSHINQTFEAISPTEADCKGLEVPDDIYLYINVFEPENEESCRVTMRSCCEVLRAQGQKTCEAGKNLAKSKRCTIPTTSDISNIHTEEMCCEECFFGRIAGRSQGKDSCGTPPSHGLNISWFEFLSKEPYYNCCMESAKMAETITEIIVTAPPPQARKTCKSDSCPHNCDDSDGVVRCTCREGFRLQTDKKTCVKALSPDDTRMLAENCCSYIDQIFEEETFTIAACLAEELPDAPGFSPEDEDTCRDAMRSCCQSIQFIKENE